MRDRSARLSSDVRWSEDRERRLSDDYEIWSMARVSAAEASDEPNDSPDEDFDPLLRARELEKRYLATGGLL